VLGARQPTGLCLVEAVPQSRWSRLPTRTLV
jgi:hypothetical protein